jgi:hemoglobin/transferrin/lactoferrin receptor protein
MIRAVHLFLVVLCLLQPVPASADVRALVGQVVDDATGAPIKGARVEVLNSPIAALTDDEGQFSIAAVPAMATSLRGVALGYEIAVTRVGDSSVAPLEIRLRPQLRYDEAVVISANREEVDVPRVPRTVAVLTAADLRRKMPRTTAEALMDLPGVLVQKTNHGGGSPYLRGLVGNHVLVLVDGVRLNNSTFRYGPNQYLATIDPDQIERVEVLRGSGSVLFGSDAVGGVINIITKRPALSDAGLTLAGEAAGKLVTSGMERAGRFEATASLPRVAVIGGLSLRDYGDLRAGGNLGVEAPSGYTEINGDAKAVVRLSTRNLLTLAVQHVYQDDVPRFDQVAQRGFSRYSFDPQIRRLGYARWQTFGGSPWVQSLTTTVSYHQSVERRDRQQRTSITRIVEQEDIGVWGVTTELRTAPLPFWSIVSGIDVTRDHVGSWRRDTDVVSGVTLARRGLYPDGATASSAAAFTHSSVRLGATTIDGGVRFSQYAVNADDGSFGSLRIRPRAWVGSLAALHEIGAGVSLLGSVSQAFRAPNVDDVSTLGNFDSGVEVPSPGLTPERSTAYEAGVRVTRSRAFGSVTGFRMNLTDLIDRVRSTYDGSEFYEAQRVFRRANVGEARVHGVEAEARWQAMPEVDLFGHLTYTHGQQITANQPMRRIPPLNGLIGARWTAGAVRPWLEGSVRFAARQDRLAQGDRDDHRIPAGGTPGWTVLNLSAGIPIRDIEFVGGVYNLFDEAYRVHGSGIDGYGRAAWVGTRARF